MMKLPQDMAVTFPVVEVVEQDTQRLAVGLCKLNLALSQKQTGVDHQQ
jgi:hypothetical protein